MNSTVISYKRKNISFYKKKRFKLTKNHDLNNILCIAFFYCHFLPIFKKWLNFNKPWLIFSKNAFSTFLSFLISTISKCSTNIVICSEK